MANAGFGQMIFGAGIRRTLTVLTVKLPSVTDISVIFLKRLTSV